MRFFIVLFFVFSVMWLQAQNNIRLYSNGTLFKVRLASKPVNAVAQAEVLIENIREDTLEIKLTFENDAESGAIIYLLDQGKKTVGKEYDYRVEQGQKAVKVTFSGIYDQLPLPNPLVPKKPVVDTSFKYNNNVLGHFCELKDGKPTYFNNLPKTGSCSVAMPEPYLAYIDRFMKEAQSPDERFKVAENTSRNNCLSVKQLRALTQYIDYEIEKLRLVKIAFFNLTDVSNKKEIEKSFRFESSVVELNNFFAHASEYRLKYGDHCKTPSDSIAVKKLCTGLDVFKNDSERYEALKKNYEENCYSVQQIKQILQKFIHDREKLDAAKILYFYCIDKTNYNQLGEVFSYNETINQLIDFGNKQGR